MNQERLKVLEMLSQGKITAVEADQLLSTIESTSNAGHTSTKVNLQDPKFLRIVVENDSNGERVNVCVPFQMLRAGVRLAALIPKGLQSPINAALKESGMQIDLNAINLEELEELVNHLGQLTVDVENKTEGRVRVFCE
jgi:hypothetical protein